MKHHNCLEHLSYPYRDPPRLVYIPGKGYEEKWIGVCGVCGLRYQVIREVTYRFSRVADKGS